MIAPSVSSRLAVVLLTFVLTAPLSGRIAAESQTRDSQQTGVDAARASLDRAIAQEKESSGPREPTDVGTLTTTSPTIVAEVEPNNTTGTATSIAAPLTAARYIGVLGAINPGADVDIYTFTAAASSRIWILTDTGGVQGGGATSRDSVIELLAADGVTVIESDDQDGTGNGGDETQETGAASVIAGRTLTAGGTYYIKVRDAAPSGIIFPYRMFVVVTTPAMASVEGEGNNTAAAANIGVANSASFGLLSGAIGDVSDVDYYSIAAAAGSTIFFASDSDPERDATGVDVVLEFRSPSDELLLSVDSAGNGAPVNPTGEGANFVVPTDGVYYLRVRPFSVTTGNYHLMIAVSVPAEFEPNNTAGTADALDFTSSARRAAIIAGTITVADIDFYSFVAAAGSRVWIQIDTGGTQNTGATSRDTVIDLLASDGVTVIETDDDDGTANGGDGTIESGLASMIGGRTLVAGGTHYIRVQAFSASGIINPYKLLVVVTNSTPRAEIEGNDSAAAADLVATGITPIGLRAGAIGAAGDVDYYAFVAIAGGILYFNVDGDPERDGTGTDLVVEVRSPADAILLSVDSSITGSLANPPAEGGNFIFTQDGLYFIKVRHFSPTGTGTYNLMGIAASGNGFPAFTNSPLVTGLTPVSAVHFNELRNRIHFLRTRFGLSSFGYSHPSLAGAVIEAEDLAEMRTALGQAYVAAGRAAPVYTDNVLVAGSTMIRAVHIEQLRVAVMELEGS